jgi:antitoxin HigA-1
LRLARYFGTIPRFWLDLRAQYDLDIESGRLGDRLDHEVAPHASRPIRRRRQQTDSPSP